MILGTVKSGNSKKYQKYLHLISKISDGIVFSQKEEMEFKMLTKNLGVLRLKCKPEDCNDIMTKLIKKYSKTKSTKEYLLSPLSNLWSILARPWTSKG